MFESLDDEIVAPSSELSKFTNRVSEKEALQRVLELPEESVVPIISFYGVGGTGKTWLLKRLFQKQDNIPSAYLDLDPKNGGKSYLIDTSYALAEIRRQLGKDISLPRFDVAYSWLRYKEGVTDEPIFKGVGALGQCWELLLEAGDAASGNASVSMGKWALSKLSSPLQDKINNSGFGEWLTSKFGEKDFLALKHSSPQDIYPSLSKRLLQDIKHSLPKVQGKQCNSVVFIDTIEVLRNERDSAEKLIEEQQWLRDLYHPLSGLLVVLGGRDRLTWDVFPPFDEERYLEQHIVGGLSGSDAKKFLKKCLINDEKLQDNILRSCSSFELNENGSERTSFHPFSLGLCADTCWNMIQRNEAINAEEFDFSTNSNIKLAVRFLKSLGGDGVYADWLKTLALPPRFNEEAALFCFSAQNNNESKFIWKALLTYSFVSEIDNSGWYQLHKQMRLSLEGLIKEQDVNEWRREHLWWKNYWNEKSESSTCGYSALSWYHLWVLDYELALKQVEKLFEIFSYNGEEKESLRLHSWMGPCDFNYHIYASEGKDRIALTFLTLARIVGIPKSCDYVSNQRLAISYHERSLKLLDKVKYRKQWADNKINLAARLTDLEEGKENSERAIALLTDALTVYKKNENPNDWLYIQLQLASTYFDLKGNNSLNLENKFYYEKATEHLMDAMALPEDYKSGVKWIVSTFNIAALIIRTQGFSDSGNKLVGIAKSYFKMIIKVCEKTKSYPQIAAESHINLAQIYRSVATDPARTNLKKAVKHCNHGLSLLGSNHSEPWANAKTILGNIYREYSEEMYIEYSQKAVNSYLESLEFYQESTYPLKWGSAHINISEVLSLDNSVSRPGSLNKCIEHLDFAMRVLSMENSLSLWGCMIHKKCTYMIELSIDTVHLEISNAISELSSFLVKIDKDEAKDVYLEANNYLGIFYSDCLIPHTISSLNSAKKSFENYASCVSMKGAPVLWATNQCNLGEVEIKLKRLSGDRDFSYPLELLDKALVVFEESGNYIGCNYVKSLINSIREH